MWAGIITTITGLLILAIGAVVVGMSMVDMLRDRQHRIVKNLGLGLAIGIFGVLSTGGGLLVMAQKSISDLNVPVAGVSSTTSTSAPQPGPGGTTP